MSTIIIVVAILLITIGIAFYAGHGHSKSSISEFLVGGRTFPAWLVFFLAVGEIYSIGTLIAFPSGIYAKGAGYGVWFIAYILLAYVFGYFLAPLIWRAAKKYNSMTGSDLLRDHYSSRLLEVVSCILMLILLIPWGQYQFIGLQVVLGSLGLHLSPTSAVVIAALLAFVYVAVSGIRSPAFVSIIKDTLMIIAVVAVGLGAIFAVGHDEASAESVKLGSALTTVHGRAMTFTISTVIFQAITFYLALGIGYILPAKSERAMKTSTIWMPLYMLIYPLLTYVAIYATRHFEVKNANVIFMVLAKELLPDWLIGLVAAGALLSGLLVLAVTALAIGGLVTRNLLPHDLAPNVQRRWSTLFVALFLILSAVMTIVAPTLMLNVLNLFYGLAAQWVPAILAVLFLRRLSPNSLSVGMIVGALAAIVLYQNGPASFGGINAGVIALAANVLVLIIWRLIAAGDDREPIFSAGTSRSGEYRLPVDPTR